MRLSYALAAAFAVLTLTATPVLAQTACSGGTAEGFACEQVDLQARIPVGVSGPFRTGSLNDIWGWTDPQNGNEYALVGTRSGTVFVDVTDPSTPLVLGKLQTQSGNSTWRDIKVYDNHAFVVSESGDHGMQVFDLTQLRGLTPDSNRDFTADAVYGTSTIGGSHNIVINEDTGFAYAVGSDACSGGLHMIDIQDPLNPSFAGCFSQRGYVHDAQCVVYSGPDTDYTGQEICVTSNGGDTVIVDVTDKSNPTFIANIVYPSTGYAHQGWFTEDQRFFVANDEADEFSFTFPGTRTIIFDMEDLDAPEVSFMYYGPVGSSDHNLYIKGRYAYLSNYASGTRILNLENIESGTLTEVAFFDTFPGSDGASYSGQWSNYPFFPSGTIVASDQDNGLFVLTPTGLVVASEPTAEVPSEDGFALSAPTPNPFRDGSQLDLAVARTQTVRAEVLDVAGRRVATLYDGVISAGSPLALRLDGTDLPAGLYLVRVTGEDFTTSRRLSRVR